MPSVREKPAAFERRLLALGCDGPERNFRLVAAIAPESSEIRRELAELDRLLKSREDASALAWKGKLLSGAGDLASGRAALERAAALEPGSARTAVWLAENLLLGGDAAAARPLLDAAVRSDPSYVWGYFFSAACSLSTGDTARAAGEFEKALTLEPGNAACLALRGLARARQGDRAGAENDFAALLSVRPAAWAHVMRSRLREQNGFIAEAVADMDEAIRREPKSAAHFGRRAHLLFCRRRHDGALADLARAIKLEPGAPGWRSQRAEVYFLLGRLEDARKDLAAARSLSAEDPALDHRLAHVLVLLGKLDAARRVLRRDAAVLTSYWEGYAALRGKDWKKAALAFGKGVEAALEGAKAHEPKLRFYLMLARSLEAGGKASNKKAGKELRICSLGLFPPYTVTVDVAAALTGCDVVFNNLAGGETAEFLWALAARVRPATYDGMEDEEPWADAIFDELSAKRTVAFATRGHAQVFGGLALELIRRCGRKIPCRCFAAVSSLDVLAAHASGWPGEAASFQAFDLPALEAGATVSPSSPLFVFFYGGVERERLAALRAGLQKKYPSRHPVRLYGPKYDDAPVELTLDRLDGAAPLHPSIVLYVPSHK